MKKNLLFILLWCFITTPLLATVDISKQENYLREHFESSTTNYDAMDVYGILNFFMQYSESEKKWNYELAGLTWEEMAQAINGNPEVIFTKLSGKFVWKDISGFKVLTQLNLESKKFNGVFDGRYFKNLEYINCYGNRLKTIDLSKNVNLTELNCSLNPLTTIDVSKNVNLTILRCYWNQLTTLNVSKNVNLKYLECSLNELTILDVSKNVNLTELYCNSNQLTTLDVSKNVNLKELDCSYTQLTTLDVSKNGKLEGLYCYNNKIAQLLVPKVHKISKLFGDNNNLKLSTLKGNFLTIKSLNLNPQAKLQGGVKGIFEVLDLSSEYAIDGKYTTYTWYDKTTQQEIGVYELKGKFYAGPENAGKTLICRMKNELIPNFVLEYEVKIKNTVSFASGNIKENIPEEFVWVGPQKNETESIQLFPNPVIDILKINTTAKVTSASVYNYAGKEVKRYPRVINNELDLQDLPAGIYIVNLATDQGILSKKIIKK